MASEDYFIATDLDALRMENELLTLENNFLKGRLQGVEQNLKLAREREAAARGELRRLRGDGAQPPQAPAAG